MKLSPSCFAALPIAPCQRLVTRRWPARGDRPTGDFRAGAATAARARRCTVRLCDRARLRRARRLPGAQGPNSPERWYFCQRHAAEYNAQVGLFRRASTRKRPPSARGAEQRDNAGYRRGRALRLGRQRRRQPQRRRDARARCARARGRRRLRARSRRPGAPRPRRSTPTSSRATPRRPRPVPGAPARLRSARARPRNGASGRGEAKSAALRRAKADHAELATRLSSATGRRLLDDDGLERRDRASTRCAKSCSSARGIMPEFVRQRRASASWRRPDLILRMTGRRAAFIAARPRSAPTGRSRHAIEPMSATGAGCSLHP